MEILNIGGSEIIIILLVVLILFGGKKIPELMRGLGKGVKEYKNALNSVEEEVKNISSNETTKESLQSNQDAE